MAEDRSNAQLTLKFLRVESTNYGPKIVLASKKKPEGFKLTPVADLNYGDMKAETWYVCTIDMTQQFWTLKAFKNLPPRSSSGARGGSGGGYAYDPLTFVSNCVGQAIAAKLIDEPGKIDEWATAAWNAIRAIQLDQKKQDGEEKEQEEKIKAVREIYDEAFKLLGELAKSNDWTEDSEQFRIEKQSLQSMLVDGRGDLLKGAIEDFKARIF